LFPCDGKRKQSKRYDEPNYEARLKGSKANQRDKHPGERKTKKRERNKRRKRTKRKKKMSNQPSTLFPNHDPRRVLR